MTVSLHEFARRFVKARTRQAFRSAVSGLLCEFKLDSLHRASLKKARRFASERGLKLQFGCGSITKTGWVNIDLYSEKADLQLDARDPFPFADRSVSLIYSEHFFEHLEYPEEALSFLTESWRVLDLDGVFSMGIPDFELSVRSYVTGGEDYYRHQREEKSPKWVTTPMDYLNRDFRQGREHKYAYDFQTLTRVLNEAGFTSVVRRAFNPGLDSLHREWGTLYIEARKLPV